MIHISINKTIEDYNNRSALKPKVKKIEIMSDVLNKF